MTEELTYKEKALEQVITRREAEKLLGLGTSAFQHHIRTGRITPFKESGEGSGKIQLFWADDLLKQYHK